MRFSYAGKNYRIGFRHDPSRKWEDHEGHFVSLDCDFGGKTRLRCLGCHVNLSHLSKDERARKTTCTIYEVVVTQDGSDTTTVLTGVARPNDRTVVEILSGLALDMCPEGVATVSSQLARELVRAGEARIITPGDRYEREKGRHTALVNALEGQEENHSLAGDRGFRREVWQAYNSRKTKTARAGKGTA